MPSNPVETPTLIKLYESDLTLAAVGDLVGLTKQGVQERLKKIGYKRRPGRRPRRVFDRKMLIDLDVTKDLSLVKVAEHFKANHGMS